MAHALDEMGRVYGWMRPEAGGRAAVFNRDITMVGRSDLVLAFFSGYEMFGGTEHVVEKAMDQWVPVYSYGILEDGTFLIGSFDPDGRWEEMTPRVSRVQNPDYEDL